MTQDTSNERFIRFARAHLPSTPERVIYPVLAGSPDRDWTAGDLAAAAGVSHNEADQALRRFAAAGIVHHTHMSGHGHRYRWGPEMAYLHDGTTIALPTDPVCGMPVPPGTPHTARDGDGQVRFCSLPCLVRWRSDQRGGRPRHR